MMDINGMLGQKMDFIREGKKNQNPQLFYIFSEVNEIFFHLREGEY